MTFRDHEVWDIAAAHSFWVAVGHTGWELPFRIMIKDDPPQHKCSGQQFYLMFSGVNVHAVSPKWSHIPLGRLCPGWKGSLFHPKQHTLAPHVPVCTLYCLHLICMQYFCSWTNVRKYVCIISALQKANKQRKQNDMLELILPGSVPRSHDFQLPPEPSGYSRSPGECFSSPPSVTWGWHCMQGAVPGTPGNCRWSFLHTCLGSSEAAKAPCTTSSEWDTAVQPMTSSQPFYSWKSFRNVNILLFTQNTFE